MSTKRAGKAVAAAPQVDRSLPALLSRLRMIRARRAGDLSFEEVETRLERIEW